MNVYFIDSIQETRIVTNETKLHHAFRILTQVSLLLFHF